jgi:hypothetical protein
MARIVRLREDLGQVTRATLLLAHWQRGSASPEWLTPLPAGPTPLNRASTLLDRANTVTAHINANNAPGDR